MADESANDTTEQNAPAADALDGRTFTGDEVTGHDLVAGSALDVSFDDGNVSVQGGCNRLFGAYSIEDGRLRAPQLASTMMACDQPLMDQDQWLAGFLGDGPRITLDGAALTLTGAQDPPVVVTLHDDA